MSATFIIILQFCVHSDKHELMQSLTEDVLQGVNFEAILNQLCEAIGQGKQTFMYSLTHAEEESVSCIIQFILPIFVAVKQTKEQFQSTYLHRQSLRYSYMYLQLTFLILTFAQL